MTLIRFPGGVVNFSPVLQNPATMFPSPLTMPDTLTPPAPADLAASLEWREDYSIGVPMLDEQHQCLLAILRRLEDFRRTGGSRLGRFFRRDQLAALLDELDEYAAYHFLTEETLMRQHLPADESMAQHIAEHRHYWQKIRGFHQAHENAAPEVPAALFDFLCQWWLSHIHHIDRELGRKLIEQGIQH